MIVVVTRQSASPRRKPSIVSSSCVSSICPWASSEARLRAPAPRSRSVVSGSESIRLWRKKAWPPRSSSRSIALRDQVLVVGADVGADRAPALGRRLDHRDVAQAGEAHLQGARDRRRREREHVDLQLQLAQQLLLLDPEALLLVDDRRRPRSLARTSRESSRWVPIRMSTLPASKSGEHRFRPRPACAGARRPRPRRAGRRGARGRCRSAAGRGSSSAPASSPACRRRRP